MALYESGENYLETILMLEERIGKVRSVDVANEREVSRASVSRAMNILKREGLLAFGADGSLELTKIGRQAAMGVYERHRVIADYLSRYLGVDEKTALEDACRIEHVLSDVAFARMREKVGENKRSGKAPENAK